MGESEPERLKPYSNVCISGGTHGNELTGIHLVKHWMNNGAFVERSSFKTHLLLSNPRAIEKCVRYIDVDLNRQFYKEPVVPGEDEKYEVQRACEIQKWIAANNVDYAIDFHNTTSNTGVALIMSSEAATTIGLQIAACVKEAFDFPVHIFTFIKGAFSKKGKKKGGGFIDLTNSGLGIEVGPLSHGTIRASIFQRTALVLSKILDTLEAFNKGEVFHAREVEVFEGKKAVLYPRDENGNISGMIHSELEGQDWKPLKKGDPMFTTFDGQTVTYQEDQVVWPTFINEAAYLENDVAFIATEKATLHLGAVQKI